MELIVSAQTFIWYIQRYSLQQLQIFLVYLEVLSLVYAKHKNLSTGSGFQMYQLVSTSVSCQLSPSNKSHLVKSLLRKMAFWLLMVQISDQNSANSQPLRQKALVSVSVHFSLSSTNLQALVCIFQLKLLKWW